METIHFRFAAGQAPSIYHYEGLKTKVLKINAGTVPSVQQTVSL